MAGEFQIDGKVYVGSSGMAASVLVSTSNQIAEINGAVNIEMTWESAKARWRSRATKDVIYYAIDGTIDVEELEFKASNLALLFTHAATGSQPLYGTVATANYWRITTSTAPRQLQWCFEFVRSSDGKKQQVYAPKAFMQNYPTPFAVDAFTLQNVTFDLLASTSGKLIEHMIALA